MSREPTEAEELFAKGMTHKLYKDPEAHKSQAISLYEKNAKCDRCGQKKMKVISWEDKQAECQNCGHKT